MRFKPLRRLGYRAICLAGRDAATESLAHWHSRDDVVENIDGDALVRTAGFFMGAAAGAGSKEDG